MIDDLEITPATQPITGQIRPPGSKSITNRALICAALAKGRIRLAGALDSEDTRVLINSLQRLGIAVNPDPAAKTIDVSGCSGSIPAKSADLYIANSGTSVRFLTALCALARGEFRLDGTARMRERPIRDLLDGLAQLKVRAESELVNGCPPVIVHASGLAGGTARVRGEISSQFLSGLLLAAPYARQPIELVVDGELVSKPYVDMTLAVMRAFGVNIEADDYRRFRIPQAIYKRDEEYPYQIEPDASAASYFFAAAAITRGKITVDGLSLDSLQGDIRFCDCLVQMGCELRSTTKSITISRMRGSSRLRGITVDMNAISDTVQTLAAVAVFAQGPTTITGVGHIRHKETDRIGNLATELRKLGATVEEMRDGLRITPGPLNGARIATYGDHRMAMSLALVGLCVPGVVIEDPSCTAKTYPEFFDDLAKLTGG